MYQIPSFYQTTLLTKPNQIPTFYQTHFHSSSLYLQTHTASSSQKTLDECFDDTFDEFFDQRFDQAFENLAIRIDQED